MDNVDNMSVSLNRRRFMTGAAGLTFGVAVGVPSLVDAANALAAEIGRYGVRPTWILPELRW